MATYNGLRPTLPIDREDQDKSSTVNLTDVIFMLSGIAVIYNMSILQGIILYTMWHFKQDIMSFTQDHLPILNLQEIFDQGKADQTFDPKLRQKPNVFPCNICGEDHPSHSCPEYRDKIMDTCVHCGRSHPSWSCPLRPNNKWKQGPVNVRPAPKARYYKWNTRNSKAKTTAPDSHFRNGPIYDFDFKEDRHWNQKPRKAFGPRHKFHKHRCYAIIGRDSNQCEGGCKRILFDSGANVCISNNKEDFDKEHF